MAASADHNLLFGLLALQTGIINQGQLVAAFQAWTLDKSKSLADHLEARGDLTGAKRELLEALAEVHLEAHGGDVEQSLAAVSAGKSTRESLAKLGYPQSYSYFTWRNDKHGLTEYFTELTQTDAVEFMRPNLFANTPDILHEYLQYGGRPAFMTRLVLAATLGATYGIYGPTFELCDDVFHTQTSGRKSANTHSQVERCNFARRREKSSS